MLSFFSPASQCKPLFCYASSSLQHSQPQLIQTEQRRKRKNEKKVTHSGMHTCTHTDRDTASHTHRHTHPLKKEQSFLTVKKGGMTELLNRADEMEGNRKEQKCPSWPACRLSVWCHQQHKHISCTGHIGTNVRHKYRVLKLRECMLQRNGMQS